MGNTVVILRPAANYTERYSQTRGINSKRLLPFIPFSGHSHYQPCPAVYHAVPNCQSIPALSCSPVNGRAIRIRCSIHSPIQVTGEQIKFQGGEQEDGYINTSVCRITLSAWPFCLSQCPSSMALSLDLL